MHWQNKKNILKLKKFKIKLILWNNGRDKVKIQELKKLLRKRQWHYENNNNRLLTYY